MGSGGSGSYPIVESGIESNLGTILGFVYFVVTLIAAWVVRLGNRIGHVEARALTNSADIKHILGDLVELKDSGKANHAETVRLIERIGDRLERLDTTIKREITS